jgi:hypothetical protein
MTTRYHLKSSQSLKFSLLALHVGVLCVVWLTDLPALLAWLISLAIFFSLYFLLFAWFRREVGNEFVYAKNRITFFAGNEIRYDGAVLPRTVVTPYFILLCLQPDAARFTFHRLICRDQLNAGEFRQLCVLLKLP